jgi:hypothetical protein
MQAWELHICRQLERRKSSSHPTCRCRSRSLALCQRHQYLPDKRVGHVSFPTKRQKRCIFYYAGYSPTLAVEGFKQSSEATFKVSRICSKVNTCWRIKDVSTYDQQAYGPTPFSPRNSQGSFQFMEQGDYKCLIYLYTLATQTLTKIKLENN